MEKVTNINDARGKYSQQEAPMTTKEAFIKSQEPFTKESVDTYIEDAPTRELFNRVEDIKETMQRAIDQNKKECVFVTRFYFEETVGALVDFFESKGFKCSVAPVLNEVDGSVTGASEVTVIYAD